MSDRITRKDVDAMVAHVNTALKRTLGLRVHKPGDGLARYWLIDEREQPAFGERCWLGAGAAYYGLKDIYRGITAAREAVPS